jgi:signal transduction histidine kinase
MTIRSDDTGSKSPPRLVPVLGLILIALCGMVDWFTGPEVAFSVIYLVPISLVAWKARRWSGLAAAVVSGLTWLYIEVMTNETYSNPLFPYWNGLVRITIFCFVAVLVSEVAERKRVERALRQARDELETRARKLAESEAALARQRGILQSVLDSMGEGVVLVDAQGQIVLSNPAADKILKSISDQGGAVNHPLAKVMQEASGASTELCLPRLDAPGEQSLLVNCQPLSSSDQQISGGVIVFSDISSLRKLERQIAEVSDREQRRLGQDLHDGLCQHLVSMAFAAQTLAGKLQDAARPEAQEVEFLAEALNDAITQARDVARGLYLVQLEVGGLSSALEELAGRVRSRHRLGCVFVDRVVVPVADTFAATDLFRIAQEAVSNAIKHANAKELIITLEADESHVTLRVADDGIGLAKAVPDGPGMGLHIMQYRGRMIGATCTIDAGAQGGTVVTCSLQWRT